MSALPAEQATGKVGAVAWQDDTVTDSGAAGDALMSGVAVDATQNAEVSQDRMDAVAKAASAGLMAHVNVESAVVNICGSGNDLMFSLICVVVDRDGAAEVMDTVSHSIVPSVEKVLNAEFTSRHIEFMCGGAVLN